MVPLWGTLAAYAKDFGYRGKGGETLVDRIRRKLDNLVPVCLFFALGVLSPTPDNSSFLSHIGGISYGIGIGYLLHMVDHWMA